MRVIAEEKHLKTDQLLYTSPVSVGKVVVGKYLALLTLFGIGILFIGLYPLLLSHYGSDVQLAPAYSGLIGFFLLGAAYIAVGTFISSLTESQPIAAVVSFLVLLLSVLISSISGALPTDTTSQAAILAVFWIIVAVVAYYMMRNITVSLLLGILGEAAIWIIYAVKSSLYEGLVSDILNCAALSSRYEDFTLGVLKYDVIVYYVSVAFLFVFLTIQSIKKKRFS
jgi:ABC-2 type transport system permease protein